ncbi:MAG: Putative cytochrome P450 hydroxylase [uncultured Acidimicrobiales bacterium]|uniref:Cytochrome P450 hydroxylase n=1 Tax=uncultured Acidimicrobiales bacterium TaxID=310071 RepID=A0A6J4H341_9ACTN|nr:MAG: Putative cytochrome P450 hydroxylase [uncultured Acidimicrobiales bacterium]
MPTVSAVDPDALLAELVATPEGRADPYPRYAALRSQSPVHRSAFGFWALSRYDDCQHLLRHPGVGKDFSGAVSSLGLSDEQAEEQARFRNDRSNMLTTDPPDHTRLRALATRAFTPRTVERLRPSIVALVEDLLDGFGSEEVDVMDALAFPLPVTVIGEMLGVPAEDRPTLRPLVRSVTAVLELVVTSEAMTEAFVAEQKLEEYFAGLVAERRAHPRDDLLTKLIEAEDQGDQLSEHELISTAILLFAAGFETTTHLIGNGLLALLRHPDELVRLRADRSLVRPAVEELLRFDSPVQLAARVATDDLSIGGHEIPEGSVILALLGAANRDPARFHDPERFDVGRDEGPPMSFGGGIHFCLGAALARLEGQIVLDRLLDRFGTMELVGPPPVVRDSLTLRGLVDLRVRFAA